MARPKIGIFGALVALGGYMAFRYVQRSRSAQASAARDLSRWEGEGGAVAVASAAPSVNEVAAVHTVRVAPGANGSVFPDGNGGAWPFPRG
ncbi:MAG TPA: hypothetical protein VF534_33425 [Paraburkholderia sp.]